MAFALFAVLAVIVFMNAGNKDPKDRDGPMFDAGDFS
jgi:hypothetical protein